LNVSTGVGKLFLWTERVASVCQIPVSKENFGVNRIVWNPNGRSFAALDKNTSLVFVYPQVAFFGADTPSQAESQEEVEEHLQQ
jgi:hypothetical protein